MNEPGTYRLFRIIPPRENTTGIKALARMLESMLGPEPISLEILLDGGGRRSFLLRLPEAVSPARCLSYLRGAHPQVSWEEIRLDNTLAPELDPAYPSDGQEMAQAEPRQRSEPCCPLRMETKDDDFREADPIVPFLHAGDDLQHGEKLLLQVVACQPKRDPSTRYRAIAAGEMGRGPRESLASAIPARLVLGIGIGLIFALFGVLLLRSGSYGKGAVAVSLAIVACAASWWLFRSSRWVLEVAPRLIAQKLLHQGYDAQVRITAYGGSAQPHLQTALAAYSQLGAGSICWRETRGWHRAAT